jgi:hypothetical protein
MDVKPRDIAIRSQDIQTGLQGVDLGGPAAGMLDHTRLVGMAARLAIHLRGVDVVSDENRLKALAARLGVDSLLLDSVLNILEDLEFVKTERRSGRVTKLVERFPYYSDIYEALGSVWVLRGPTDAEQATVSILNDLSLAPRILPDIERAYPLGSGDLTVVREVGKAGGYFSEFESPCDGQVVVCSAIYWDENPEAIFSLLQKYEATDIANAIQRVRAKQGLPLPDLSSPDISHEDQILLDAMVVGILPAPTIDSTRGPKRFAFTPYAGSIVLGPDERALLQKARAILSCVRYGEAFGMITKIHDPEALIGALETRGRIGSHSEIPRQYAILAVEGIARITPDTVWRGRYYLELIDTEENKKALRLAADMLTVGEALAERGLSRDARAILFNGGIYKEPLTTVAEELARRKRTPNYSAQTLSRQIEQLVDDIRGV